MEVFFLNSRAKKTLDEFLILTELVKKDRDDLFRVIYERNLFSVTQRDDKDKKLGDTIIHYAVLAAKADFIRNCSRIFENEINTKDFQGNSPLHLACLLGNPETLQVLL